MEGRTLVAEALLAGAESTEVLSRLGNDIVEEVEVHATGLLCRVGFLSARAQLRFIDDRKVAKLH